MKKLWIILHIAAALIPLLRLEQTTSAETSTFPGWPETVEGRSIKALPLTDEEKAWHENFPGHIGRFTDGEHEIIIRWTDRATRKLHFADICLKGTGYTVQTRPLLVDSRGNHWAQNLAQQNGKKTLEIRERIYDEQNNSWSDSSSWYWAALLKRTHGPWWAVTISKSLP
ncbi:MAG: hypothetical protein OEM02_01220 [Desulfobulbaceae bacterium]|nr:hypothetical protein [Desulfobulbaceae bacterium]